MKFRPTTFIGMTCGLWLAACSGDDGAVSGDGTAASSSDVTAATSNSAGDETSPTSGTTPGGSTGGMSGEGETSVGSAGSTTEDGGQDDGDPVPFNELSDEFDDPSTLSDWTLRHEAEGGEAQYTLLDIGEETSGHLTWVPTTSGWFREYDGPFMYKLVEGDFVVEAWVQAASLDNPDVAPTELFNSAGVLVRDPDHGPGRENWLVHNVGRQSPMVGTENKNTVNSSSQLTLFEGPHRGRLRICRIGGTFILLRQLEGENAFTETLRYVRDDLPEVVQVGPMVNGWNSGGNHPDLERTPDIRATFDYIRFWQPSSEADCSAPQP